MTGELRIFDRMARNVVTLEALRQADPNVAVPIEMTLPSSVLCSSCANEESRSAPVIPRVGVTA